MQATETTVDTTAATSTTQTPGAIGTVQFNGVGLSHDDVAAWLDALSKEKGLANPTFSSSAQSEIGSRIVYGNTSSADLTTSALSNRYNKAGG
jgi:Tfp pilus assembly protein PilN